MTYFYECTKLVTLSSAVAPRVHPGCSARDVHCTGDAYLIQCKNLFQCVCHMEMTTDRGELINANVPILMCSTYTVHVYN